MNKRLISILLIITLSFSLIGCGDDTGVEPSDTEGHMDISEALEGLYSYKREEFSSDEEFTDFRALTGGSIKANFVYRGASVFDDKFGRASYADSLLEKNGIRLILDVDNTASDISFKSEYTKQLYDNDKVIFIGVDSYFATQSCKEKIVEGFRKVLNNKEPFYVQSNEGDDLSSFVCILIEGLAGASYDELVEDYMKTYENRFGFTYDDDPSRYDAIVDNKCIPLLGFLHNSNDESSLRRADYYGDIANYLYGGGMSEIEIKKFVDLISK